VLRKAPPAPPERAGRRKLDASSPVFTVDHSACILCDRCVRGCDAIKESHVIGRMGKGYSARIAFDLDAEEQAIVVAIGCGRDHSQPIAGGLALHPQLLARAAKEGDVAGFHRHPVRLRVGEAHHQ